VIDFSKRVEEKQAAQARERLKNWKTLNAWLRDTTVADMEDIRVAIKVELAEGKRMLNLQRLIARYNKLEARLNGIKLSAAYGAARS
jgi:hypothetical protein